MTQLSKRIRVLIVDDCVCIRTTLRAMLNGDEYVVVGELSSGEKLLSTIEMLDPDIICLDHLLPNKDGMHLLGEIRTAYPNLPVVMITGSDDTTLQHVAAMLGIDGFIYKPFSQKKIFDVLQEITHAKKQLMILTRKYNSFPEDDTFHTTAVVADDSRTVRRLLITILTQMGIEVVGEAYDGMQATELVAEHKPDIACLDFDLPMMNGIEALKIIRSKNDTTKIVMTTTLASRKLLKLAVSAGAAGFIIKPFYPETLKQNISRILKS
ncbi:two-component system, chemotaxis family, response regulator CheY [Nitrosomonas ureae]|uniref:Two-component system, chemotaxis family, response regulator CheY n=1 Tax=Nitrosomonas ureae TaxID=44577 RepID=A0A1H2GRJ8_9PROT|nr:histidine kinase [Nitrosomonas ureae]SDU22250.1 two-component system, chemotaxis family, response regulator CheY [Nitrosomonas ureae]